MQIKRINYNKKISMISETKMTKRIKLKKNTFFIFNICKKIPILIKFLFYILYISELFYKYIQCNLFKNKYL